MNHARFFIYLSCFLFCFFSFSLSLAQEHVLPLFQEIALSAQRSNSVVQPRSINKTIKRSRVVNVFWENLGTQDEPGRRVELNLFENTNFVAIYDRSELIQKTSFSWIGHIEGVPLSQVIFVIREKSLRGSISMPGANFSIRLIEDTFHIIEERDHSQFPQELEPVPAPKQVLDQQSAMMGLAADELCSEITVLVAYSPEARAAEGGTADMEALINLAVAETNQSYINSGINQSIILVHTIETQPSSAANSFSSDLSALSNLSDGRFETVDAYRELYHADLVALIIEDGQYCGLGYLNSSASSAFTVTSRTCATGYYSFGHELGHNMGARHDWYVDHNSSSAKGYVNFDDNWRTIMGYNSRCRADSESCSRIQYWSNPNVTYGNPADPMGVSTAGPLNCVQGSLTPDPSSCAADNRTQLNGTCSAVANFRQAPSAAPDLIVFSPEVNISVLSINQSFSISATTGNKGGALSNSTNLHYFLSTDSTITTSDVDLGSKAISSLSPSRTVAQNISLSAPATQSTYYVGACVVPVSGESNINNNCSDGTRITILSSDFPWPIFLPAIFNTTGI